MKIRQAVLKGGLYNIRKIEEYMQYLEKTNQNGIIININYEKALDSINWNLVYNTLNYFHFGPNFIKYY